MPQDRLVTTDLILVLAHNEWGGKEGIGVILKGGIVPPAIVAENPPCSGASYRQ